MPPYQLLDDPNLQLSPMNPRVLFIDLDGTVVNSKGRIDPECRNQILKLRERGVEIGIATGRPYFAATEIIRELEICSPSMFFSGALIIDPSSEQIHLERTLNSEQVGSLVQHCQEDNLYCELYKRDGYKIARHSELTDIHLEYLKLPPDICNLNNCSDEILKAVIVIDRSKDADFQVSSLKAKFPELNFASGYGAAHPHIEFVNVTTEAASRQTCFEAFLSIFKVDANDIIAIGDAEADIPFISMAGAGVAMGNAPDSVKRSAHFVTKTVDQQGFAFAMERLVFHEQVA